MNSCARGKQKPDLRESESKLFEKIMKTKFCGLKVWTLQGIAVAMLALVAWLAPAPSAKAAHGGGGGGGGHGGGGMGGMGMGGHLGGGASGGSHIGGGISVGGHVGGSYGGSLGHAGGAFYGSGVHYGGGYIGGGVGHYGTPYYGGHYGSAYVSHYSGYYGYGAHGYYYPYHYAYPYYGYASHRGYWPGYYYAYPYYPAGYYYSSVPAYYYSSNPSYGYATARTTNPYGPTPSGAGYQGAPAGEISAQLNTSDQSPPPPELPTREPPEVVPDRSAVNSNQTQPATGEAGMPRLSPAAAEVVKLSGSGVGDEVAVAYIKNSKSFYNLGANEILALRDAGVSSPVISAMLSHDGALRNQGQQRNLTAPAPNSAAKPSWSPPSAPHQHSAQERGQ